MTAPLIVFFVSIFAIYLFLVKKANDLIKVSEKEIKVNNFKEQAKKTLNKTKEDFLKRIEELLQLFLSFTRKIVLKVEQIITKWLYYLKKKKKTNDSN
jgi:hypothetical protein